MNSEIEQDWDIGEMVHVRFRVEGERTLEIPKKDWVEKWEEKVEECEDEMELSRIVYEIEKDSRVYRWVDDEWMQYDYCEPA